MKEEQLQQKQEEVDNWKRESKGYFERSLDSEQRAINLSEMAEEFCKQRDELQNQLTKHRELMDRMANCLRVVYEVHKYELAKELLTDYKNL